MHLLVILYIIEMRGTGVKIIIKKLGLCFIRVLWMDMPAVFSVCRQTLTMPGLTSKDFRVPPSFYVSETRPWGRLACQQISSLAASYVAYQVTSCFVFCGLRVPFSCNGNWIVKRNANKTFTALRKIKMCSYVFKFGREMRNYGCGSASFV